MNKFTYIRSPALLKACRAIACQYVASLCYACHGELDQGATMSRAEREGVWLAAHMETVKELVDRNLWPANLQAPELIGATV